jgi:Uma2 family endonuclease
MVHAPKEDLHGECLHLPRAALRFPIEWRAPEGFRPDEPSTWPRVDGRLEYVNGRIRYIPPCGGVQQHVASNVTWVLGNWWRQHSEFVLGSNEAGMIVNGTVRGADAAVWRRSEAGDPRGFRRTAPVLAVEVAGQDESEDVLREKAAWYLEVGVSVVWLVLPESREVVAMQAGKESRHGEADALPEHPALPELRVQVADLFWQLGAET